MSAELERRLRELAKELHGSNPCPDMPMALYELEAFAVAAARIAAELEREECAAVAESVAAARTGVVTFTADRIADAIRARGKR